MKPKPHRYLIPLAAFLAVLPLLLKGPTCGHDFDFHLLSWLEAATQYAHGGYPHWAFTPAYNAGEPRFLFYPPISWTLGALLTLALPIQFVATIYTFLALTLSGFTAHRLASRYASPQAALLCATVYLANPYMLFTAYERSAFAELLAAAWLPLLFQAALAGPTPRVGGPLHDSSTVMSGISAARTTTTKRQILRIAIPIALLWLTNAPAAVMACYALAILTLTKLIWQIVCHLRRESAGASLDQQKASPWPLILSTLAGTALGLLLPAFYLLPAAYERRYVQIALATTTGMRPADHFLFHRMGTQSADDLFHNAVVQTASILSLLLLTAIALAALNSKKVEARGFSPMNQTSATKRGFSPGPRTTLLPLTILIAFLLTPPSLFLWTYTPQLAFLQFPWRLDALLAVILLTLAAAALRDVKPPFWLSPAVALLLILPAYNFFHQACENADAPNARAALFHSPTGTEPTDEYTPVTADNDALHQAEPWWRACLTTHPDPNLPSDMRPLPGPAPIHIEWDLPCNSLVVLNRRDYPNWLVAINGHRPTLIPRDDGRIAFIQPQGHMSLHLRWVRTRDQNLGLWLSALALLTAFLLWILDKKHPRSTPHDPAPEIQVQT